MSVDEARAALEPLIRGLDVRDRLILEMRFFRGCTQAEIGKEVGVTQMQVSRLIAGLLARLREQVESLMKDRVTPAVADAAARAESAVYGAADTVRGQVENVSGRVREQPMIAVLIAAGIGFVIGRALR